LLQVIANRASDAVPSDVRLAGVLCALLRQLLDATHVDDDADADRAIRGATRESAARAYVQQQALSVLQQLVSTHGADAATAATLRSELDLDALVRTMASTSNPQTQRHVLALLAESARRFPSDVLGCVMPVFEFVGATALRRDDAHTFAAIERTIRTLVPAVIAHARRPAHDVANVIDVFVNAAAHVPSHRRLLLCGVLSDTLAAAHVAQLPLRLIASAARTTPATPNDAASTAAAATTATSFDAVALAADLLRSFDAPRCLSCVSSIVATLSRCQRAMSASADDAIDSASAPGEPDDVWVSMSVPQRAQFVAAAQRVVAVALASSELLGETAWLVSGVSVTQSAIRRIARSAC
jgi:hypothetical protein